jgi:hypothetical protein
MLLLSERYPIEPEADELIVWKNDVFGVLLYTPIAKSAILSARYAIEPEADELIVWKNDVFGALL